MKERFSKIKMLFESKDSKILIENFFSLSFLQGVNIFLPFITLPYIIRVLGKDGYGIIVFALSLINYFSSVTQYSFNLTGTRFIAKYKSSKLKIDYIFSVVLSVRTILCFLSSIVIILIVFFIPLFRENLIIYLLWIPHLWGLALFPSWFFQGMEKMKYITFINVSIKVLFTLSVFIFIKTPSQNWLYPLLLSSGSILSALIGILFVLRQFNVKLFLPNFKIISRTLKNDFPIFINQFLPTLYNNTTTFILGIFSTPALVAIYDSIKKITDLLVTVTDIISRVFFPFNIRKPQLFKLFAKKFTIAGFFYSIVPIFLSKLIAWYLDLSFNPLIIISILSAGVFFIVLYDAYGINYFIARNRDKIVMKNTLLASFTGFILSIPMISNFGIIGAATNLALSRGIMGLGLVFIYIREKKHFDIRGNKS